MLETIFMGLLVLLAIIGIIVFISRHRAVTSGSLGSYQEDSARTVRWISLVASALSLIVAAAILAASTIVFNGVGEAKVFVNLDGTLAGSQTAPGTYTKAPWQTVTDFDLFSQEVVYAGKPGESPVYTGGTVNGAEVTVSVGGVNGGSTQANLDISVTYSLDGDQVEKIYKQFKSQERFTKQVVEKSILTIIRQVPGNYSAVDFRGQSRAEAADKILALLSDRLGKYGVSIELVSLQDIRYPQNVEDALAAVEAANQDALKAEADLKAAEVKAQQKIVEAQATADANKILAQSLTPELLQQKYIDALGSGTVFVVPEGSTPLVTASK